MKRIITLITLVLVSASTLMYAQSSSETRQAERKAQREAQKAREKAENERNYAIAVQALERGQVCIGSRPAGVQERTERICFIDNKLRSDGR